MSFSSTIRLRQACRSPYSLSTRSSLARTACSIRAISRRAALLGSGAAEGPDAVDVLVQPSSIVRARCSSLTVRTTATTSMDRPRSLSACQRPRCASPQERSAVAVSCPGSTYTKSARSASSATGSLSGKQGSIFASPDGTTTWLHAAGCVYHMVCPNVVSRVTRWVYGRNTQKRRDPEARPQPAPAPKTSREASECSRSSLQAIR